MCSSLQFLLKVEGDVAQLLLDITDDFTLRRGVELVAALGEVLDQELREVTAGQIDTKDGVRERETLVDRDGVGDTITGVEHDTGCTTGRIQGEDGLDGDVEGGSVEGLEHDLCHILLVCLGIERRFGEEDGVLFRCDTEGAVEVSSAFRFLLR